MPGPRDCSRQTRSRVRSGVGTCPVPARSARERDALGAHPLGVPVNEAVVQPVVVARPSGSHLLIGAGGVAVEGVGVSARRLGDEHAFGRLRELSERETITGRVDAVGTATGVVAGIAAGLTRAVEDLRVLDIRVDHRVPEHRGGVRASVGEHIVGAGRQVEIRHLFVIVLRVLHHAQHQLLQVRETARLARLLARLGEDGEQDRRQDGDDRDHDQQLDQGETLASHVGHNLP